MTLISPSVLSSPAYLLGYAPWGRQGQATSRRQNILQNQSMIDKAYFMDSFAGDIFALPLKRRLTQLQENRQDLRILNCGRTFNWLSLPCGLGPYIQQVCSEQQLEMLQHKVLTPKNFLKTPQLREKYECWICYEVCIKPVRCKGTCGHIFCMKCVSDTRNNNSDRCPSRCSAPFLVTPIPEIEIEFYCPYNPSQCSALITSVASFHSHYKCCQFVSEQQLAHRQLQNEYRCLKGHFLQFYVGSYEEMINSTCVQCQQAKLCRSFCRICDQFYCVSCRIPPCSKQGCPISHSFTFQRIGAINYICDICGISTAVSNGGVYDDKACNFGLCESCFEALPENYDESKPRAIVANINSKCSCGYDLLPLNEVHKKSKCELCKKLRQCIRYCQNCEKRYCVSCKLIDIYSDLTCGSDHELIKVTSAENEAFMRIEKQFGCMRCFKQKDVFFFDQKCYLRLCEECMVYSMKVTTDKQRPVSLTCNKNHILNYICDEESFEEVCCKCHNTKVIKLVCISCEEDERMYCFQCKPIPLRTCYFRHQLKEIRFEKTRECHYCRKSVMEVFGCGKCAFYVCAVCVERSLTEENCTIEAQ